MKIHIEQLECLCVLEEPVMLKTQDPIIDRDTVIEENHIEILKKFRIDEVEVKNFLANGQKFVPEELNSDDLISYWDLRIKSLFKKVLLQYKEIFMVIQSKGIPNFKKVDNSIEELLRLIIETKKESALLLYRICEEDDYIYNYAICTAILAGYLSYIDKENIRESVKICKAGLLSNIGIAQINGKIIRSKKQFSQDEMKEWDKHSLYGYQIISNLFGVDLFTKNIVVQHEELLDGTGFPLKLRADKICMGARFVGIAETYYRYMCSNNFFVNKTPFQIIRDMYQKDASKYDQAIVRILVSCYSAAFKGAPVRLSNGKVGRIVEIKSNLNTTVLLEENSKEEYITRVSKIQIESIL